MKRSIGYRSRTRKLLRKKPRERGLPPPNHTLREFNVNQRVAIKINPSIHKGQPHRRFHGLVGLIMGKRGRAYLVRIKTGNKLKTLIVRPEHLIPLT